MVTVMNTKAGSTRRIAETRETFQPVLVRMPPELHQAIKQRAEDEERTMAQTIRRALKRYLET